MARTETSKEHQVGNQEQGEMSTCMPGVQLAFSALMQSKSSKPTKGAAHSQAVSSSIN